MESKFDLAKWLAGEMTKAELEAFEKSPEFSTYKRIKDFSSELEVPEFDSEKALQEIISYKYKKKGTIAIPKKSNWIPKIAAVMVIALGLIFFIRQNSAITEKTSAGEKATFLLPDNSKIVLNAESEIKYKKHNWKNNRELKLDGEAFFKVAKGQRFDVNTSLGKVTVLGTQFNVKSRIERFEVECYEGKVKVSFNGKEVLLTQGKSISIQNGKEILSLPIDPEKPSWLKNEMKFNSSSLIEVVSEVERQYGITIENKFQSDKKFNGILPSDNLETAMEIISKTYKLSYTKSPNQKLILTNE